MSNVESSSVLETVETREKIKQKPKNKNKYKNH